MVEKLAVMELFTLLAERFGPQRWWPAETPFEVCVGAILTQNTAWGNVEKALENLKKAGILNVGGLQVVTHNQLAELIRPSGCYRVKSRRLKDFVSWFCEQYNGDFEQLFARSWRDVRPELLGVPGIGPETCDAILLYAGQQPTFVVDSYTRRLFHRLGLLREKAGYEETRSLFMDSLPADPVIFNEYHALIVQQCKQFCRKKPICSRCPLVLRCFFVKSCQTIN